MEQVTNTLKKDSKKINSEAKKPSTKKEVKTKTDTSPKRSTKTQAMMDNCDTIECERQPCGEEELSQEMYKSCNMAVSGIDAVSAYCQDRVLKTLLNRQKKAYDSLAKEIELKAIKESFDLKPTNLLNKAMLYGGVMFNTITDKSASKIAEIMIQGINMGIISVTKVLNKMQSVDLETRFADKLLSLYEKNLDTLKLYL